MSKEDPKIRILIADDHPVVRQGLINIIERDPSFQIVAQAGDGNEILSLIRERNPHIVLLDIAMPNRNGLEVLRDAKAKNLPTKFIILTMYKDEEYFDEATELGVKGYLLKDNTAVELLECLRTVSRGKYYISPELSGYLIDRNIKAKSLSREIPALGTLTATEKRVLKLISENKTSKEIAEELFISIRTVQNHRNNICHKLELSGHNKLLQFALEHKSYL